MDSAPPHTQDRKRLPESCDDLDTREAKSAAQTTFLPRMLLPPPPERGIIYVETQKMSYNKVSGNRLYMENDKAVVFTLHRLISNAFLNIDATRFLGFGLHRLALIPIRDKDTHPLLVQLQNEQRQENKENDLPGSENITYASVCGTDRHETLALSQSIRSHTRYKSSPARTKANKQGFSCFRLFAPRRSVLSVFFLAMQEYMHPSHRTLEVTTVYLATASYTDTHTLLVATLTFLRISWQVMCIEIAVEMLGTMFDMHYKMLFQENAIENATASVAKVTLESNSMQ
jgi:hypothetical protein